MILFCISTGVGEWTAVHPGWEAECDDLMLQGWKEKRRVVIVRRKIFGSNLLGVELTRGDEKQLSFIDGPENTKAYEYSVLVTSCKDLDLPALFHHYRDRADCENNFDELKSQSPLPACMALLGIGECLSSAI